MSTQHRPIDARQYFHSEMIEAVVRKILQPYEDRGIDLHVDFNDDPEVVKDTRETVYVAYSMLADLLRDMAGISPQERHRDWQKARERAEALEGEALLLYHLGEALEEATDDHAAEHYDEDEEEN